MVILKRTVFEVFGKQLKYLFRLAAVVSLILAAGLGYLIYASLPKEHGVVQLSGLSASATVNVDRLGLPSIHAKRREDAFALLGFLHARDRLFQMDLMRRKSAGRLAEIFGAKAVGLDKSQRDYQFVHAAQNIVATLPGQQKSVLGAYVAGINAYLAQADLLPPEFIALNYRPDAWTAEDSLLVALGMFQTLNGWEEDERMATVMETALPPALFAFLTPDSDLYATPLVGGAGSHRPEQAVPVDAFSSLGTPSLAAAGTVDTNSTVAGSNNWAVAGGKTADGRAMIANDMHLHLSAPNIWYRAELHYAGRTLNGVTLPGVPLLVVGSNGDVAWGFTNATADLLDLTRLDINPNNSDEYLTPQGWRPFDQTASVIKVKEGDDIHWVSRSTIWGPVASQPLLGRPVAIKWTALDAKAVDLGLLDMDSVTSTQEAMTAVNRISGPPQNVVFADRDGHIGWTLLGRFPKRIGFDGLTARSWADAAIRWDGYIPPEDLPRLFDPPAGFIVTANNRTVGSGYPYVLGYNWGVSYRAHRIGELLQTANGITEQDMLRMQLDTRSELFEFYRQLALETLNRSTTDQTAMAAIAQALRNWDGSMNEDSSGAALLFLFRQKLAEGVFAKVVARCRQFDPQFHYSWREMETPLRTLLSQRPAAVLPTHYHDDWDLFILETLKSANRQLARQFPNTDPAKLRWGSVNHIVQAHPFSTSLPMLASFLNIGEFGSSGCASFCVQVMSNAHGASQRLVVSPGHPEDAILEMPGGQSGHPFSPHYRDQQPFWQAGAPMAFQPQRAVDTLHFAAPQDPAENGP